MYQSWPLNSIAKYMDLDLNYKVFKLMILFLFVLLNVLISKKKEGENEGKFNVTNSHMDHDRERDS